MKWKELVAVGGLFVMALPAIAQSVDVDYDKSTDFSRYETYAWKEGHPAGNPLTDQRIVAAVDYHLAMKGFRKVDSEPDMYVAYHASIQSEIEVDGWGYWGYRRRGRWVRDVQIRTLPVGTVVVDFVDAADGQCFWRGVGSAALSPRPEKNERKINKAAEKMFKKFPPDAG